MGVEAMNWDSPHAGDNCGVRLRLAGIERSKNRPLSRSLLPPPSTPEVFNHGFDTSTVRESSP